jgi:hypothetical protein
MNYVAGVTHWFKPYELPTIDAPEYCECSQIDGTWDIKGVECCIDCGLKVKP